MNDTPEVKISTTSTIHLNIANLHFKIYSPDLPLLQENDPIYKQFLSPAESLDSLSVSVTILVTEIPPLLKPLEKTFATEQAWDMYSDSKSKFIVPRLLGISKAPRWLARINPDYNEITVFCSEDNVRQFKGQKAIVNPVRYPLDQILLINLLADLGLLVHAAGFVIDKKGFVLAGHSGAGKSTISELLRKNKSIKTLSDDRIVIHKDGQEYLMSGTPWPGDAGIAVNDSARLHGIFFLKQSDSNYIRELNSKDTLKYLFKVGSIPWYDKNDLQKSLDFCDDLLKEVKTYELNFRPGPEIVEDIMSFVSG